MPRTPVTLDVLYFKRLTIISSSLNPYNFTGPYAVNEPQISEMDFPWLPRGLFYSSIPIKFLLMAKARTPTVLQAVRKLKDASFLGVMWEGSLTTMKRAFKVQDLCGIGTLFLGLWGQDWFVKGSGCRLHRFAQIRFSMEGNNLRFGILLLRDQRMPVATDEDGNCGDMGSLFKVYCLGSFLIYSRFLD